MEEIKVTVTKTAVVEMRPVRMFIYFDEGGKSYIKYEYGEYHDGVLHRVLKQGEAPQELAQPVIDFAYEAMQKVALDTKKVALEKAPEERDENEAYLAALYAAGE